jgi:uncharacterized membrane protein SirB2
MEFHLLKAIHVSTALVSYVLFFVRGVWMMDDAPRLRDRWVKVAPHVNDTVLLGAALWMAALIHQYPLTDAWLTAKAAGLVLYIALGVVALRTGRTRGVRIAAWVAAQAVFFYIVAVAVTRNPLVLAV